MYLMSQTFGRNQSEVPIGGDKFKAPSKVLEVTKIVEKYKGISNKGSKTFVVFLWIIVQCFESKTLIGLESLEFCKK